MLTTTHAAVLIKSPFHCSTSCAEMSSFILVSLLPASALRNAIAALQPSLVARFSEQSLLRPALRMGCVGHRSLSVARRAKDGRGDWRSFEPYPQLIAPIVTIFDGPTPLFMDTAERLLRL
jgi:hypothetical protein